MILHFSNMELPFLFSLLAILPSMALGKYRLDLSLAAEPFTLFQDPMSPLPKFSEGIPGLDASFDYVVVGAGTAGIPLAVRLAENNYSVALVEAGGVYQLEFPFAMAPVCDNIGSGADMDRFKSPLDWGFVARNVPGANYRDIHYPRGKCLGGSYVPCRIEFSKKKKKKKVLILSGLL